MQTTILQVNAGQPEKDTINRAAAIIRGGGLVAFPTETVYGLGADATNEAAVRKIFDAKGRPADNPLIVHVSSQEMLRRITRDILPKAETLMKTFWPGPLTLVLTRTDAIAPTVSAGLQTVAVRMPQNDIALALIAAAGTPIAAPSANRSGRPSPTTAAHVAADLDGRIDMILDGGATDIGIESTVIDMTDEAPLILRPGWLTREAIESVIGPVGQAVSGDELKRSPGTRYRHYSPRARVVLIENGSPEVIHRICTDLLKTAAVALLGKTMISIDHPRFTSILLEGNAEAYARTIYAALRELDEKNPDVIVVEGIADEGAGAAVMDRLRRAASEIKGLRTGKVLRTED